MTTFKCPHCATLLSITTAAEENRDRAAERVVLEQAVAPTTESVGGCPACEGGKMDACRVERAEATYGESERQPTTIEQYRKDCGHIVSDSYDRMCTVCGRVPVHKNNKAGICPDCYVAGKARQKPEGHHDLCTCGPCLDAAADTE